MALDADRYRLNEADHQEIFENEIKPDLFAGAKAVDRPIAVILGGAPGSGKSAAVDAAHHEPVGRGGEAAIIGDDLRGSHPRYDELMARDDRTAAFYTDRDTGRWVEKAIAYAKDQRVNLIIEGTMRDSDKVAETMRGACVKPGIRSMRAAQEVQLYSNEIRRGDWHQAPSACAVIDEERNRSMTLRERGDYLNGFDEPARRLARPERGATPNELRGWTSCAARRVEPCRPKCSARSSLRKRRSSIPSWPVPLVSWPRQGRRALKVPALSTSPQTTPKGRAAPRAWG